MGYYEISRTYRPNKNNIRNTYVHTTQLYHILAGCHICSIFFFFQELRRDGSRVPWTPWRPGMGTPVAKEFSRRPCFWQPGQGSRLAQQRGCSLATPTHTSRFLFPRKGKKATLKPKDTRLTRRPSKNCMLQGAPRSVGWRNEVIKAKNEYA